MALFALRTNEAQLSSTNQGHAKMDWAQVPPTRDVTHDNFAKGAIHFRWEVSGQRWWIPGRTYLRFRFRIAQELQAVNEIDTPSVAFGWAPNMFLCANLFQNYEFRINDKVVCRVSDYPAQIEALHTRLTHSKSWMDSIGKLTFLTQPEAVDRLVQHIAGGAELNEDEWMMLSLADVCTGNAANGAETFAIAVDTNVMTLANGAAQPTLLPGDILNIKRNANYTETIVMILSQLSATTFKVYCLDTKVTNFGATALASVNTLAETRIFRRRPKLSGSANSFEVIWQPALSIFQVPHALPSGRYELILLPQQNYSDYAFESVINITQGIPVVPNVATTKPKLLVIDFYLYLCEVEGPRVESVVYVLDLNQIRCQAQTMTNTNAFQQEYFNVSPSTTHLTLAFQDVRAGAGSIGYSASKFLGWFTRRDTANAVSLIEPGAESLLRRFYINYAGSNKPQPDAEPQHDVLTKIDFMKQRYVDSQVYAGAFFDNGGCETYADWKARGPYYHFAWPRDGTDRSQRVNVHYQFSQSPDVGGYGLMNVLLFDHYKIICRVRVENSRVVDVQVEQA